MEIYLNQKKLVLDAANSLGEGGEAVLWLNPDNPDEVIKVFKGPDHPALAGMREEQDAAKFRLEQHQQKLLALKQRQLPLGVVGPKDLAVIPNPHYQQHQSKGKYLIAGYTMDFVRGANTLLAYSDNNFKKPIPFRTLMTLLRQLYQLVAALHQEKIIIGDFNDLNVMVAGEDVYLIDVDSYQFDQWFAYAFTQRFLDPLVGGYTRQGLTLTMPYRPTTDWYAFAIMLMQTLLSAGPYSGITNVKSDTGKRLKQWERVQRRLTVFSPDVKYPTEAIPFGYLPDDVLHHLDQVFVKDKRGEFPATLLQFEWHPCDICGIWHARAVCPSCARPAPASVKQTVRIRGTVTSTRIFKTSGYILFATWDKEFRHLYWENGVFYREHKREVFKGDLDPFYRYRISAVRTLMGKQGRVALFDGATQLFSVDSVQNLAMFDANAENYFWVKAGRLQKNHALGSEFIGQVLPNQTYFWVGEEKGFGFYSAGNIKIAFIFSTKTKGINDSIAPLDYRGQLVDSTAVFGTHSIWVFYASQEQGVIRNRCRVYDFTGTLLAAAEGEYDDGTWLGRIRGKTVLGNTLLSITPDGISRFKIHHATNTIVEETNFPDTEPFVNLDCHLFISPAGLYVVDRREIRLITIK